MLVQDFVIRKKYVIVEIRYRLGQAFIYDQLLSNCNIILGIINALLKILQKNIVWKLTIDSVVGNGCKSFGFGNFGIKSSGLTCTYKNQVKTLLYN